VNIAPLNGNATKISGGFYYILKIVKKVFFRKSFFSTILSSWSPTGLPPNVLLRKTKHGAGSPPCLILHSKILGGTIAPMACPSVAYGEGGFSGNRDKIKKPDN